MGGYGSGRQGGRPTSEACGSYVLSAKALRSIPHGVPCTAKGTWTWSREHHDDFAVDYVLDTTRPQFPFFELTHVIRSHDERSETYRIYLTSTPTRFGGRRWWWLCPRSHSRSFKLILPRGGHQFWARTTYGLGYACQRETKADRLMRRARKLNRALGGEGGAIGDPPPGKPKWMRWKTWEQKYSEWEAADERADQLWAAEAMRRFSLS